MASRARRSAWRAAMRNRLENARIEQIFESGLHEFCETAIKDNSRLGAVIAEQYLV